MDFGDVLTKAWKIIWKFKVLWIFGILASCGQNSGGGGGGGNSGVRFSGGDPNIPPWMRDFVNGVENFFENMQAWQGVAMVIGFLLFILILVIFFAVLNTIGRVGLIQGTVKAEGGAEIMTFGELFNIYSAGTIVFSGGSLVPLGGQNPLEPAVWGKAVFYGPHMENFLDAKAILEAASAGVAVQNSDVLAEKAVWFLDHPGELTGLGERAREAVLKNQGSAEKHARVIERLLDS